MTNLHRTDWEMVDELVERAGARVPDYADEVIAMTGHVHQRPAWTFPGRWLPSGASRVALRWAVAGALLALVTLAGLLLWAGAQPTPIPVLTGNGLLAVTVGGEPYIPSINGGYIATLDPGTGRIVTRPSPAWAGRIVGFSPDGTRLAYIVNEALHEPEASRLDRLFVSAPDGSGAAALTGPLLEITSAAWAPDGRSMVVAFSEDALHYRIAVVATDGSGMRVLEVGMQADQASWQPTGDAILFRGWRERPPGLYTAPVDDPSNVRHVGGVDAVASTSGIDPGATWSPDGTRIAYVVRAAGGGNRNALHIVGLDGSDGRVVLLPGYEEQYPRPRWAPDGSGVIVKTYMQLVFVPVDGAAPRPIGPRAGDDHVSLTDFVWSPDGRWIAAAPQVTRSAQDDGPMSPLGPGIVVTDVEADTWRLLLPGEVIIAWPPDRPILAWQPVAP